MRKTPITEDDIRQLLDLPGRRRGPASFRPVRCPVTGRMDMVPVVQAEWGSYHRSPEVEAIMGTERFAIFWPESFEGKVGSQADLHDAVLVELSALVSGHADASAVTAFANDWRDASRLVLDRTVCSAAVSIEMPMEGKAAVVVASFEDDCIVMTMFCTCGDLIGEPIVYWSEDGSYCTQMVEEITMDMVDAEIQADRVRVTSMHLAAQRVQDARPAGVVDMQAFRMRREARAA